MLNRSNKYRFLSILLFIIILLVGCSRQYKISDNTEKTGEYEVSNDTYVSEGQNEITAIVNMGISLSSCKTYWGTFFEYNGTEKLIGGTEASTAPSNVYIIDCSAHRVEEVFDIDSSATLKAFFETVDFVYLGG